MKNASPAAGYIRMSSDQQAESPARQRAEVESLASREGYTIVEWYEDHGQTGTESSKRKGFQKLLKDAVKGQFSAVLMYEQSRLTREDVFDTLAHFKVFHDAGVRLITCLKGEIRFDDLGGMLMAVIGSHEARAESVKLSQRSQSGRLNKLRQGKRHSNVSCFGYDREISDHTGKVVKRVHFRERFKAPTGWNTKFVPSSDKPAVDALKRAFQMVAAGKSCDEVARDFNKRGVTTRNAMPFTGQQIKRTLLNPTYIGALEVGKYCNGKFSRCDSDPAGRAIIRGAHEALVSEDLFNRVGEALECRALTQKRREFYPLSGIIRCGHCHQKMCGRTCLATRKTSGRSYMCRNPDCDRVYVVADRIDNAVIAAITREAQRFQSDIGAVDLSESEPAVEATQLKAVRDDIRLCSDNLMRAKNDDEYAILSLALSSLRAQECELRAKLTRRRSPECGQKSKAIDVLNSHQNISLDKIEDHGALATAIRSVVKCVTVLKQRIPGSRNYLWTGTVDFDSTLSELPIYLKDSDIGTPNRWKEAAEIVLAENLSAPALAVRMGITWKAAYRLISRARRFGALPPDVKANAAKRLMTKRHSKPPA